MVKSFVDLSVQAQGVIQVHSTSAYYCEALSHAPIHQGLDHNISHTLFHVSFAPFPIEFEAQSLREAT